MGVKSTSRESRVRCADLVPSLRYNPRLIFLAQPWSKGHSIPAVRAGLTPILSTQSNHSRLRLREKDIRNLREEKMRQSLHTISRTAMPPVDEEGSVKPLPVLDVTGVGSVEIASFRPFVKEAFRTHLSCVSAGTGVDATSELPTRWRGGTRDSDPDGLERPRALADKEATQDDGVEPPRVGEEIPARSIAPRGASRLRRFRS